MNKREKVSTVNIIVIITVSISVILVAIFVSKQREERDMLIRDGKDGIGTVINKHAPTGRAKLYYVYFDFKYNDKVYINSMLSGIESYQNAIIGMKYRIKFCPDDPAKSIIFIDQPIPEEYINIQSERDRIMETHHPDSV